MGPPPLSVHSLPLPSTFSSNSPYLHQSQLHPPCRIKDTTSKVRLRATILPNSLSKPTDKDTVTPSSNHPCNTNKAHLSKSLSVRRRIEDVWAHVLPRFAAASSAKRDVNAASTAANALPNAVKRGLIQHGNALPKGEGEGNEGTVKTG